MNCLAMTICIWRKFHSGKLLMSSLSLSLSQLTEIMQLMNAYFSATRRQLGKDDYITNPKLHPSLLELPSHPVWGENDSHTHSLWLMYTRMHMQSWLITFPRCFGPWTNSNETVDIQLRIQKEDASGRGLDGKPNNHKQDNRFISSVLQNPVRTQGSWLAPWDRLHTPHTRTNQECKTPEITHRLNVLSQRLVCRKRMQAAAMTLILHTHAYPAFNVPIWLAVKLIHHLTNDLEMKASHFFVVQTSFIEATVVYVCAKEDGLNSLSCRIETKGSLACLYDECICEMCWAWCCLTELLAYSNFTL